MLDLIKFELYKIFSKKSVKAVLLITVLFSAFYIFSDSIGMKSKGLDSLDDAYNIMKEHEGKVITEEGQANIDKTLETLRQKKENGQKLTKEEAVYMNYLSDAYLVIDPSYIINNR